MLKLLCKIIGYKYGESLLICEKYSAIITTAIIIIIITVMIRVVLLFYKFLVSMK